MKKQLLDLKQNLEKIVYVHYSCENLGDDNEGLSPRITSIAVLSHNEEYLKSFAFHLYAEELGIKKEDIETRMDEIEKALLIDFFDFVSKHLNCKWIHWNMKDMNYGFDALEHRYKVLVGKKPLNVPEENRYNLSKLIALQYGSHYVDDPKMPNLMELNGGKDRFYISGGDEVLEFKAKNYIKMHQSTICKVKFFRYIFIKLLHNEVKTKKKNMKLVFNNLFSHPLMQFLSLLAMFFTLFGGIAGIVKWIFKLVVKQ